MRTRMGLVGAGLMVLSASIASSASTKTAEARAPLPDASASSSANDDAPPATVTDSPPATSVRAPASTVALDAPAAEVITAPPSDLRLENPRLRRLQKAEITPAMRALASSIVRRHHAKPVGTQVEVALEGKQVIARIERHFHPEGGSVKPWGFHPGVSLFVAR